MQNYELIFAVRSGLSQEDLEAQVKKIQDGIKKREGSIIHTDDWGLKKLAYPIKNHYEASYYRIQFEISPNKVSEIREILKVDENILRYLIIFLDRELGKRRVKEKEPKSKITGSDKYY